MTLTGVILAGGGSTRMGPDKALVQVGGTSLLEGVARAAVQALHAVWVVGRDRPLDWPFDEVTFRVDDRVGEGPMGGLLTALRATETDVLALACDMPALRPAAIEWLVEAAGGDRARDGLVVVKGGRLEPLFAVYRRAVLPRVESRLAAGRRSLMGLLEAGEFTRAQAPWDIAEQLVNINRPEDLARYLASEARRIVRDQRS